MSHLSYSQLYRRLVLDRQTAEKVGHLSQLLLDAPTHSIVGFTCGGDLLGGSRQTFHWKQVYRIGNDSLVIDLHNIDATFKGTGPTAAPINYELWTDGGNKIGKITDLDFDPDTGAVTQYIFAAQGWQGLMDGTYQVPPIAITSIGSKRVILLENLEGHVQQHQEGLGRKVNHVTEFLKADYEQTKDDISAIKHTTQAAVEKVKEVLPLPQDSKQDP